MEKLNERILKAQIERNILANGETMRDLFLKYDLAVIADSLQEDRIRCIYDIVLSENDFRVGRPGYAPACASDPRPGDRVTSDRWSFLLSDADFDRLLSLAAPRLQSEGITDGEGYYINDTLGKKVGAFRALVDFVISSILPESMREPFRENRNRVVPMEKLLDTVRPLIGVSPSVAGVSGK